MLNEMSRRAFLATGVLLPFTKLEFLFAQDAKVETIVNNGPAEHRFDLVFLPEGYTKNDRKQFDADVAVMLKALDRTKVWQEYKPLLNVHQVWVPSEKAWSSSGSGEGTAIGVTYDSKNDHLELKDKTKRDQYREQAKADLPIILVKTTEKLKGFGSLKGALVPSSSPNIFLHEFGHGFDLHDEYRKSTAFNGANCSGDAKNPPWKDLIGRVKGIETNRVKNIREEWYRGEKDDCLMGVTRDGLDYGPLCTNGIITYLRKTVRPIENAPKEETLKVQKGKPLLELALNNSKTFKVVVQAWYCTGNDEELDKTKDSLPDVLTPAAFKDEKKWKKATISIKGKTASISASLAPGSYLLAILAYDPNPAIILDPNGETRDRRLFRLEVRE